MFRLVYEGLIKDRTGIIFFNYLLVLDDKIPWSAENFILNFVID